MVDDSGLTVQRQGVTNVDTNMCETPVESHVQPVSSHWLNISNLLITLW